MSDQTRQQYEYITSRVQHWKDQLEKLQETCLHTNATFKHGADTGNWCRDDDSYWKDFTCPDCGKRWREYT